ncbi:MAG TPA: hypothetical protein VHH36_08155 [Candidatus Thermoplasmatota archaeon]|nr:hypothetical protein [Candidatus Thermoplasmatota archaeon]
MRRAALLLAATAAAALLAGCAEPSSPIEATPYLDPTDALPGRPVDVALFLNSTYAFKQALAVGVDGLPDGWRFSPAVPEVAIPGRATMPLVVTITPAPDARVALYKLDVKVGDTRATVHVNVVAPEPETNDTTVARLTFAAWRADGTLAGSNHPSLANATIPGAGNASAGPWRVAPAPGANATAPPAWLAPLLEGGNLAPGETRAVALADGEGASLPGSPSGAVGALIRLEALETDR